MKFFALKWENDKLLILDQRYLPHQEVIIEANDWTQVEEAIKNMAVRGAPMIGVAAAYGLALAKIKNHDIQEAKEKLAAARPTAVNLTWALERVAHTENFLQEAHCIANEEAQRNENIAVHGAELLTKDAVVLTICNTGSLATPGIGTALGIIRKAYEKGKLSHVFVCETRPRQQGLKLTAWELLQDQIPFTVMADGAAGILFENQKVNAVIVGADRIAVNGDTANKVGTYMLSVLAKQHSVPFIVAAPSSTIDKKCPSGKNIRIEERSPEELTYIEGVRIAPQGANVWNPAFDVTPAELVSYIVTEIGIAQPPYSF
jgi:methylthioribose-1-phosphate isomerase